MMYAIFNHFDHLEKVDYLNKPSGSFELFEPFEKYELFEPFT